VLHWAPRIAVGVGLFGLLVVGWQYVQYATVFGDDPCRSRGFCDERAIALGRRDLSGWYLGFSTLTALGFVAILVRRSWQPGDAEGSGHAGLAAARHAGLAGLLTFVWLGWLAATFAVWLFAGAPFVLAVAVTWLAGLTSALDRMYRRAVPVEAPGVTLLVSGAAATGAVVGAFAGVALVVVVDARWGLVLPPLGLILGVVVVTAVARVPNGGGPALAVSGTVVAALVCAVVVGVTDGGRDTLRTLRDEFHPDVPAATAAPVHVEPIPTPLPPGPSPSPTTRHTRPPVKADRPCGPTDLELRATGWDSAMGDSSVTILATNRSVSACWVEGYPQLRLFQGADDLSLDVGHPRRGPSGQDLAVARIGVRPGERATFGWWWKGYRQQADQHTPQTVVLNLGVGKEVRLELPGDPYLVDVVEGAKVDVTPWGTPPD
jgi:hypothetical protein